MLYIIQIHVLNSTFCLLIYLTKSLGNVLWLKYLGFSGFFQKYVSLERAQIFDLPLNLLEIENETALFKT